MTHSLASRLMIAAAMLVLITAPASAAVIKAGSDLWRTPADGSTFADFGQDPIPAGFFCSGSAPFTGRITFQGAPLITSPAGVLGETDTIVERLDDARFDRDGVAHTRTRVTALSLVSREPVVNACGSFDVAVGLAPGPQPENDMRIARDGDSGGTFQAPLTLDVRMIFTPVGGKGSFQVLRRVELDSAPEVRWTYPEIAGALVRNAPVLVDTDGDRRPEALLAGTSNFAAGWAVDSVSGEPTTSGATHCGTCTHGHQVEPLTQTKP